MMRFAKIAAGVALVLLVLAAAALLSGRQHHARDLVERAIEDYSYDFRSRRVALPGQDVELHIVESGLMGRPVILLHGFPEFWWSWRRHLVGLGRLGYHGIAPDQRGYNASDKPGAVDAYRIDVLAADVVALIEAMGFEKAILIGHDLGARVAWHVAIHHPERVEKLMIFQGAHPQAFATGTVGGGERTRSGHRTFFRLPLIPQLALRFGNWAPLARSLRGTSREGTFPDEVLSPYRQAWDRDGAMRTMLHWYRAAARETPDLSGDMTIRVPTRIVFGLEDAFIDERFARASMRFLSRGELVEVPEASHWILQEEPELTLKQMADFLGIP